MLAEIIGALQWVISVLLGPLGTSVAIMAVALIGFAMLRGRLALRRGAAVVTGCFILFSSRAIAAGLLSITQGTPAEPAQVRPASEIPPYVAATPPPIAYDPYAGASVPVRSPDGVRGLLPR